MKTIFLAFFLAIVANVNAQTVSNKSIYNVDAYIDSCLTELNLKGLDFRVVVQGTGTFRTIKETCTVWDKDVPKVFSIYVYEESIHKFQLMLAHELVHVKQIINKELITGKATYCYDYGKVLNYDKKFEVEANKIGEELYAKYKNVR